MGATQSQSSEWAGRGRSPSRTVLAYPRGASYSRRRLDAQLRERQWRRAWVPPGPARALRATSGAGMTFADSANPNNERHARRRAPSVPGNGVALSPHARSCAYGVSSLACDGAFGSSTQRGSDRRLEGWPSCWRAQIQEACCRPLPSKRQQWPRSAATAERHMAGEAARQRASQPAAACSGAQNRRHAGAARQPRGPLKGPGGPSHEGLRAGPAGPAGAGGQPAPGSPMRRPRTRRTFAWGSALAEAERRVPEARE